MSLSTIPTASTDVEKTSESGAAGGAHVGRLEAENLETHKIWFGATVTP
jgi:hypothetical protein